jgi:hypothetical protein
MIELDRDFPDPPKPKKRLPVRLNQHERRTRFIEPISFDSMAEKPTRSHVFHPERFTGVRRSLEERQIRIKAFAIQIDVPMPALSNFIHNRFGYISKKHKRMIRVGLIELGIWKQVRTRVRVGKGIKGK